MPSWRDYLTEKEVAELDLIANANRDLKAQYRRIYDRCRKRMAKETK